MGLATADKKQEEIAAVSDGFVFTSENFQQPELPSGLQVIEVPVLEGTSDNLEGYGYLISGPDERSVQNKNFEIVPWPVIRILFTNSGYFRSILREFFLNFQF